MFPYAPELSPLELKSAIVRNPLVVSPDTTVMEAIAQMSGVGSDRVLVGESCGNTTKTADDRLEDIYLEARSSCVVVVEDDRAIGILTQRDVVRLSAQQQPLDRTAIGQVMVHPPITLRESACTDLLVAMNLLQQHHLRHLPILDDRDRLVGLVTQASIWAVLNPIEMYTTIAALQIELQRLRDERWEVWQPQAALRESQQAEMALAESERQLSTLISNLPGYVYRVLNDPDYTPEFISQGVEAITGYRQEEYLIQRSIACGQEIHPEDADRVWEIVQTAVGDRQPYEGEYRIITKTGEEKWVWERGRGIYAEDGSLLWLEGFVTDISDRQAAQAALREQDRRIESILNSIEGIVWSCVPETLAVLYISPTTKSISGRSASEFLANSNLWFEIVHPHDRAVVSAELEKLRQTGSITLEYRIITTDGQVRWLQDRCHLIYDPEGKPCRIDGIATDITALKETQESLRVSEERLRLALTAANQGLYDLNIQTGDAIVSPEYAMMLGYDPSTFQETNAKWIERLHPDDREPVANTYRAYVRGEIPDYAVEFRQRTRSGDWKWILSLGKIVAWDEAGNPLRMLGTHTDISDRKQAEADRLQAKQIRTELKLLEDILEIILAGYWDWDIPNHKEYLSPGFKRMFGYADAELPNVPETWQRPIFPEDLPGVLECLERHVQSHGEIPFYNEVRYRHKDGSTVWVICSGQAIEWDEAGNPLRMIGCHIDITKRKQSEQLLLKSDTHLKTAQRIGKLGSWEFEIQTGKLTWSEEVFRIYGLEPAADPPSYEQLQQYIHPEDWEHFDRTVQAAINSARPYDLEHRLLQPDGTLVYVLARGDMVYDATGQLTHIVGTTLDITERKQAEATIQQTAAQLAASNRELEAFAYSVSHDLRAPLRAIDGFSKALLEDYREAFDEEGKDYFDRIRKNVSRMGMLIDDLLNLSRVSRSEIHYTTVNLSTLAQELIEELQASEPERQVELAIARDIIVYADTNLMRIVLTNLFQNAWKFTSQHPTARIELGAIQQAGEPIYFIRDDGAGFDMAYAKMLFGVFQRLHSTHEFPGTGIGLATVQRIIHRHGGRVWAEGAVEQGATFYFTVPHTHLNMGG